MTFSVSPHSVNTCPGTKSYAYGGSSNYGMTAGRTGSRQQLGREERKEDTYLRSSAPKQQSAFGDFTGNTKQFSKPKEDESYQHPFTTQPTQSSTVSKNSFTAPVGLRNIGNTCFMNSILQPVLATPYLNEYFLGTYPGQKQKRATRLADAFHNLLLSVRQGTTVTPSDLKNQVARTCSTFAGYGQQDAQEFMRFLLDRMHDELNRVSSKPPYQEMNYDKLSVADQSEKWWNYARARDDSIITDLFEGQLMNRLQCLSCGHQALAFDNF